MRFKRLVLPGILCIFLFPVIGDAASILDDVNFIVIREMQLRKEKETYFMDVTHVIRNSSNYALKFENCRFKLSFVTKDVGEIKLGSVLKNEILLERKADSPATDTSITLSPNIGSDIQAFHLNVTSSEEMNSMLMASNPSLRLHIQGNFNLGMGSKRGWVYQPGIKIDWILPIEVVRDVFVNTYKAIERAAGKGGDDIAEDDDFLADIEEEGKFSRINEMVLYFSPGEKTLTYKSKARLIKWMKGLQEASDKWTLHVEGYADGKDAKHGKVLATDRAGAVYDHLAKTLGLKWKNVKVEGFGRELPATAKDDDKNRVEIYFTNS